MIASAYTKAVVGALVTFCGAAAAAFGPDTTGGKWLIVAAAALGALLAVMQARNTQTVTTGPGIEPVVSEVLDRTGKAVGRVVADTGTATGGVVAGTTGAVGKVLDATVGKLLPSGGRRADG